MLAVLSFAVPAAAAERAPPAWPLRFNLTMPLGSTWGREKVHGFTWGFRPALLAYPTAGARGVGFGGFADLLIDARTHMLWSYGGIATVPVWDFDVFQLRVGGLVGVRRSTEAEDPKRRLSLGALSELTVPAYFYDFRVGLRLDGSIDDRGVSATSFLFELDVVGVLGLLAYASAGK